MIRWPSYFPSSTLSIRYSQRPPSKLLRSKCGAVSPFREYAHKPLSAPRKGLKPSNEPSKFLREPQPAPYDSLYNKLARDKSPSLLYQVASQRQYLLGCYTSGIFFISMAAHNYQSQYLFPAEDLPKFVPVAIGVGCFIMTCFGFWLILRTQNVIKRITSIPSSPTAKRPSLLLRIERLSTLPFVQPKILEVPPGDVTLSSPLCNKNVEQKVESLIAEMTEREKRIEASIETNILTLPFRQANYWIWRGFVGVRRAFTNEGFQHLHIKGQNRAWKLDTNPAWAMDDGKVLDKLVKIKIT